MRVTQKEIASKMGVSISLVSRVLSGTAGQIGVPHETIREIQTAAEQMGYVPNKAAQALKGKATKTIGVVVYDFKDPFFSEFVGHVQEKFHSQGYSTILVGFSDRQINERDLTPLREHVLDAVIILGSDFQGAIQKNIHSGPIFRIGHGSKDEHTISFCPDEEDVAETLATHLVKKNLRGVQIVHSEIWNHRFRADSMKQAMHSKQLNVTSYESSKRPFYEAGYDFVMKYLDCNSLPDVIVCTVDHMALGVMRALMEKGLSVPSDIKVTGFDDIRFSAQFYPSLTTFHQPMSQLVDKILSRIKEGSFETGVEFFKCQMVSRDSC